MESPLFSAESLPYAVTVMGVLLSYASECFCVPVTGCMQALESFVCLVESVEYLSVAVTVHISVCLKEVGYVVSVSQLVEALRDKLEGQRFGSMSGHWNFSLRKSFQEV